jgi:hypothetical protein
MSPVEPQEKKQRLSLTGSETDGSQNSFSVTGATLLILRILTSFIYVYYFVQILSLQQLHMRERVGLKMPPSALLVEPDPWLRAPVRGHQRRDVGAVRCSGRE